MDRNIIFRALKARAGADPPWVYGLYSKSTEDEYYIGAHKIKKETGLKDVFDRPIHEYDVISTLPREGISFKGWVTYSRTKGGYIVETAHEKDIYLAELMQKEKIKVNGRSYSKPYWLKERKNQTK